MDYRGQGLSDRTSEISLEGFLRDVAAVVERLGWRRLMIYGHVRGGMIAIAYAHANADRIAGLILDGATVREGDRPPEVPALAALRDKSWDMYVDAIAHVGVGWERAEEGRQLAALFRVATTEGAVAAADAAMAPVDLTPLLPELRAPTLILQRPDDPFATGEGVRRLATSMPNARVAMLRSPLPGPEDIPFEDTIIEEFLDEVSLLERAAPADGADPLVIPGPVARLTPREIDVLRLIVAGQTNKQIATELVLSPRTVARHIANIYDKIDSRGKAEATAYAIRHGLVS
jgi:DNA-binding CsgD family transcriptional regulator